VSKLRSESKAPYKTRLISRNESLQKVKNLHKFLHFDDSAHSGEPSPFHRHKMFGDDDSLDGDKSETSLSPGFWEVFMEFYNRDEDHFVCE